MKKIIILLLIFCSISKVCAQTLDTEKLKISFNDFFEKDTISLKINRNKIFNNIIITSRESIGFADLDVKILTCNKAEIYYKRIISGKSKVFNKVINLKHKLKFKDEIDISLVLNGKRQNFKIDLKKGRYAGFDKDVDKAEFILSQSQHPFEYD